MTDAQILVLADDLTGALEVGAKFASAGVPARVCAEAELPPRGPIPTPCALVLDTETRHAPAEQAMRRVFHLASQARQAGFTHVFKKTDSTLRGNIAAELAALVEAWEGAPLLYVPAYPKMGRTVRGGSLHVDGVPVTATCFAKDPFNPVRESHIPSLLAARMPGPLQSVPIEDILNIEPRGLAICDGETDADVEAAAHRFAASAAFRLAAGPACFVTHLARLLDAPRREPASLPRFGNALIVNGSLHAVSSRQIEYAKLHGFAHLRVARSATTMAGGWCILDLESSDGRATLNFAEGVAESVCDILRHAPIEMVAVFGGDTTFAIVGRLGNPPLDSVGEVMEGIPLSRIPSGQLPPLPGSRGGHLHLVTKAGGFGSPDVLCALRDLIGER